MATTDKALITVYLSVDLKNRLEQVATKLDRPRNWCVVKAIEAWLDMGDMLGWLPEEMGSALEGNGKAEDVSTSCRCAVATLDGERVEESTGGL